MKLEYPSVAFHASPAFMSFFPLSPFFFPQGQFPQELPLSEGRTASITNIVKDLSIFFLSFFFPLFSPVL